MKVSVAICTYNRADEIAEAILSVINQDYHDEYEMLIIDNRSTDDTISKVTELIKMYGKSRNIKYFYEDKQGLSAARNRAISEAKGEYVVFLDDDAIAEPSWLSEIIRTFHIDERIGCVGGKIDPIWLGGEPVWLPQDYMGHYSILNHSDHIAEMHRPSLPFGANVAFKKEVFAKIGLFREDLGRVGSKLMGSEESELISRLRSAYTVYYTPFAVVKHKIPSERTTRKWFLKRMYWQGVTDTIRYNKKSLWSIMKSLIWISLHFIVLVTSLHNNQKAMKQLAKISYKNGAITGAIGKY